MPKLHTIIFLQPAPQVIIASAQMAQKSSNRAQQKSAQSACVRLLLQIAMQRFGIVGEFYDHAYPYHIQSSDRRYFVSFSHSKNRVGLIISLSPCAIDIETKDIKHNIAERYFHPNEIEMLSNLSCTGKQKLMNFFWRVKECRIKLFQDQLYTGMGADMTPYLIGIQLDSISLTKTSAHYLYNHPDLNLTALF
ncbi:4'-phosphopantetheinyl transferase family protein [Moraxella catarrhalis]|uniref:4'-phosphopantetheinyl transferase domain-containing protein n=1 Tax=Moraxella catarrhalis TaxID=480 RepID=A0A198UFV6_MORCA|nr:4'-phosphopantetheinyl transferase superfamily protein [Moraxella catarrhalis]OAU95214.1 hypothetical protein AO384_1405 [Moraxella catarrhalis]OAU99790.1 hypothetical protein AO383_0013 [Moraxella catarrhalis]OAV01488.1 hypothetical protein AO385_1027 [Moraxella catarrhalis]